VVGIAVSDVRLIAYGDLLTDLVTNVIIVTNLLVLDGNVGVDLVEFYDIVLENFAEICAHGVIEFDCYRIAVIGESFLYLVLFAGSVALVFILNVVQAEIYVTADERESTKKHCCHQKKR
jgi:hypothetical protein